MWEKLGKRSKICVEGSDYQAENTGVACLAQLLLVADL